ncbi:hypothetical protein BH23ACT6_BH23ACT6_22230 [soil metagenome]
MPTDLKIAVIIASSRPQRVGPAVAQWFHDATGSRDDVSYELIDLADQDLPNLDEGAPAAAQNYTQDHTKAWSAKIAGYDGFVFVTPEYNRGIPGQLKNALDFLYAEWNDKAAGIVCYGSSGGLRAAEQLKQILGELQVATVPGTGVGIDLRRHGELRTDDAARVPGRQHRRDARPTRALGRGPEAAPGLTFLPAPGTNARPGHRQHSTAQRQPA